MKGNPEMFLGLKVESWRNLFEVVRDKDTKLFTKGNFWAAVQDLEEQLDAEIDEYTRRWWWVKRKDVEDACAVVANNIQNELPNGMGFVLYRLWL